MKLPSPRLGILASLALLLPFSAAAEEMDKMWGESVVKLRAEDASRGQLFADGNYAMFIHWGLYSPAGQQSEWQDLLRHRRVDHGTTRMAGIPGRRIQGTRQAHSIRTKFDAKAIATLAKDAGMKYIIITAKHHDGFAMYRLEVQSTSTSSMPRPSTAIPMKELAEACQGRGFGFGFYYSHNQDWTFPGGNSGPATDANGKPATFDDYFAQKVPAASEGNHQPIRPDRTRLVRHAGQHAQEIRRGTRGRGRKNQPNAMLCGRAGHGLGDYQSLGDMEVPVAERARGYGKPWTPPTIPGPTPGMTKTGKPPSISSQRLIATVARGGTYMLNIGPRGDGSVPERAADTLRNSGEWIHRHPHVVYGTDPSPWGHALPWGDVTVKDNTLFLAVFNWPASGKLYLPGLKTGDQFRATCSSLRSRNRSNTTATTAGRPSHRPNHRTGHSDAP